VSNDVIADLVAAGIYALPLLGLAVVVSAAYWLGYRRGHFLGGRDARRQNVRDAYGSALGARLGDLVPAQREPADD
jgi:hypothetical protein